MANLITIKSRKLGTEFNFEQRGGYLYVNGYQICHGGGYMGETMWCAKDDTDRAVKMCRAWYSQMMRKQITLG